MLTFDQLEHTLVAVLDSALPACAQFEYRLVGTAAALLQGVALPAGDVDILLRERQGVDAFGAALSHFACLRPPVWMPHGQYYAEYDVHGAHVELSTVEVATDADGLECVGRGPWEHYVSVACGPYTVPVVALELRLVTELARDRPDRYLPLVQHLRVQGCDTELVCLGLEAYGLATALRESVLHQLAPLDAVG